MSQNRLSAQSTTRAVEKFQHLLGNNETSEWHVISQSMVQQYADLSGDGEDEWVHLDPIRAARELPFGGTIVQGFFQVSHLVRLAGQSIRGLQGVDPNYSLNYGFDRMRFVNAMPVGARFRARTCITEVTERPPSGAIVKLDVHLELESGKPTLVAEWLFYLHGKALDTDAATKP